MSNLRTRVIDHKKVLMTDDEWLLYQKICDSYAEDHQPNFGKELFQDLFEVDEKGIIICLIPPSHNFSSFEVVFFLMQLMQQQHLRIMYQKIDEAVAKADQIIKDLKENGK